MDTHKKIVGLKTLQRVLARLRRHGRTIVFTNGCFDILHFGHVQYLEKAKGHNRVLIIGLNSDRSVRKIKGPQRPIVVQNARAAVLAALACVDYVTIFAEETPQKLIAALKPDVLVKGADWKGKEVAGSDVVRRYGGRVEYARYVPRYSSTNIIDAVLLLRRRKGVNALHEGRKTLSRDGREPQPGQRGIAGLRGHLPVRV